VCLDTQIGERVPLGVREIFLHLFKICIHENPFKIVVINKIFTLFLFSTLDKGTTTRFAFTIKALDNIQGRIWPVHAEYSSRLRCKKRP